jgi:short-subunit dehydrogenase
MKNKVVVITGGSDGIGKALVELYLSLGATVATCARNYDKLYQLQQSNVGKPLLILTADLSNETECKNFIDKVVLTYSKIDILINNAGISMRSLFAEVEIDTLKKVMDINFWGSVFCTKFCLPHITKSKGSIVAISSIAGYRGLPGRTGYCASKFAVNGFFESLRTELLHSGVNVLWVCPGFTSSNIRNAALNSKGQSQGESQMNEGEMMSSEECAKHIVSAIGKRKRTMILSFKGKQTVFMNKFFAKLTDKLTYNFFFKNHQLIK